MEFPHSSGATLVVLEVGGGVLHGSIDPPDVFLSTSETVVYEPIAAQWSCDGPELSVPSPVWSLG